METLAAETFENKTFGGRNRAVLLGCAAEDGTAISCVVKLAHRIAEHRVDAFWSECVAGLIAERLGVVTPQRFVVDVSPELAEILGRRLNEEASALAGPSLGVTYLRDAFMVPNETGALEAHHREAAARIAALDVFIDNPDRRKENPNCLVDAGLLPHLVAIDHDLAFTGLYLPIFGSPWPTDILANHLFGGRFGRNKPDLAPLRAAIAGLNDSFLDALPSNIPGPWLLADSAAKLATVVAKLKQRRDTIEAWFPTLETWIERS